MDEEKRQPAKFYLKWPWNLVVYIVLALLLRIFAIPVILLLMAWNKKQQPEGPAEGYCLQRTRMRLAHLGWAALFLLIGVACGALFVVRLMEDKTGWELMDYATLAVAGVSGVGGVAAAVYEGVTSVRDALFPEKSRLARSIRSQLPYPEEAPGVKELFAMVDADIRENGQWFDRVAVGREWVLGDDVSALSRIRVIFGRDELKFRNNGKRTQSTRIIELYILDDRRQLQLTGLRDPNELTMALSCLKLRAPEALFRPYSEYPDYCGKSEEEWQQLERDYQKRLAQRLREGESRARSRPGETGSTGFILVDLQGRRTSHCSPEILRRQFEGLGRHGQRFALEPLEPISTVDLGELTRLECGVTNAGPTLVAVLGQEDGSYLAYAKPAREEEALAALNALLEEKRVPCLSGWESVRMVTEAPRQAQTQRKLSLRDRTGATHSYSTFTRRDVELAGEGLASGKYTMVTLSVGTRYLYLQAGDREDGRVTVNASRPDPDELRLFETKCGDSQAQTWLLELLDGQFEPDFSQWKDITKQIQKRIQNAKQAKK